DGIRDFHVTGVQTCALPIYQWLRGTGARPLFDLVDVDNGDPAALRHWQHHLGVAAGAPELPDWSPATYAPWTLSARREVNPGSRSEERRVGQAGRSRGVADG